ncbi:transcriptional regulator [Nitritalea halalkaliphila LW7]|uniref:Transcriptional regulator n=1 Tax=Nitritalea halalkaliphila LW7 TaxID=1189621 RepID=I5BXQ0_9BACT|nr:ATP-binding protein [Nitritalea halalkaliphila]EIM74352.1 transcriptional regulator [Nitritalea halalkaliphila LW7]
MSKTVVAFANDAGGELYIGIKNNPRALVGIPQNQLDSIENRISNIVLDSCAPIIQPEISFLTEEDKHIIRVYIHKGSKPPYFLKNKGKNEGTFIRVGSSNRLGDRETIFRLERSAANSSFDAELNYSKDFNEITLDGFAAFFKEKTGEELTEKILEKLNLVVIEQGQKRATK